MMISMKEMSLLTAAVLGSAQTAAAYSFREPRLAARGDALEAIYDTRNILDIEARNDESYLSFNARGEPWNWAGGIEPRADLINKAKRVAQGRHRGSKEKNTQRAADSSHKKSSAQKKRPTPHDIKRGLIRPIYTRARKAPTQAKKAPTQAKKAPTQAKKGKKLGQTAQCSEGQMACLSTTSYAICSGGQWGPATAVAAGTTCTNSN